MSEGTFNPSDRRLCPDGSCIGLVGADGRCRVCSRSGSGAAAASASWDTSQASDTSDTGGDTAGFAAEEIDNDAGDSAAGDAGSFSPDRRLCEDGSCVGVIGAGGVCSVCGRPPGS